MTDDMDLMQLSDEHILNSTDALHLSKLNALALKRSLNAQNSFVKTFAECKPAVCAMRFNGLYGLCVIIIVSIVVKWVVG